MKVGVFCNTRVDAGGEQSGQALANMLGGELISLSNNAWKGAASEVQVWYMNDAVYKLIDNDNLNLFKAHIGQASKCYIVLNFVLGGIQRQ